jgi:hypothetical protein
VDTFVVVWGGVLGWALLASALAVSTVVVGALVFRPATRFGRVLGSILRSRPLARAAVGDRVIVFGRVEVDGPAARRFDDLAPCALSALETPAGVAVSRGAVLFLRTRTARIRLSGAVSIEATSDSHAAGGNARVAALAIGENALVVGRYEREARAEVSGYREPVLAVAIGASTEPIDVIGTRRVMRSLSKLASAAAAPALALAIVGAVLATASLREPRFVDEFGARDRWVPAHLALPLLSPVHRDEALRAVDAWLVLELQRNEFPDAHLFELAVALRPIAPSCDREARLAYRAPGHRRAATDGCDEVVGRFLIAVSDERDPDLERRRGYWDDLVVSVARAPSLADAFACGASLCTSERDEWERVDAMLRGTRSTELDALAAMHLRRLAIVEAAYGSGSSAARLASGARLLHENAELDDSIDAALAGLDVRGAAPAAEPPPVGPVTPRLRFWWPPRSTVELDLQLADTVLRLDLGSRRAALAAHHRAGVEWSDTRAAVLARFARRPPEITDASLWIPD